MYLSCSVLMAITDERKQQQHRRWVWTVRSSFWNTVAAVKCNLSADFFFHGAGVAHQGQ